MNSDLRKVPGIRCLEKLKKIAKISTNTFVCSADGRRRSEIMGIHFGVSHKFRPYKDGKIFLTVQAPSARASPVPLATLLVVTENMVYFGD